MTIDLTHWTPTTVVIVVTVACFVIGKTGLILIDRYKGTTTTTQGSDSLMDMLKSVLALFSAHTAMISDNQQQIKKLEAKLLLPTDDKPRV